MLVSLISSQIFSAPPYNFDITGVGLTSLSPFVATLIGSFVAKPIVDGAAVWMAKHNSGIFEPEFRLVAIAWYAIFAGVGFFGAKFSLIVLKFSNWCGVYSFGGASIQLGNPWPVPVIVGLGLISFGLQIGSTVSIEV